ncbi:MAG: type II toxin-antitoxin system VapC family toxin [Solirubrobacterales bacterium]|nr:type II toxin-antitoxin system VapC family toxin [Solirubrobacterales bacterium]MBV9310207.1 type II toxin-antitoxin system VapC family toxin [Solirubrobacterales bacterium]
MPTARGAGARGVYAIEDPALLLPDPLALDTSFVVEALIETQPLHARCAEFATRVAESGVRVVTSELLEVELAEAAFAIALKERWGRQWRRHRSDGRARRRGRRLLNDVSGRYGLLLTAVPHIDVSLGRISAAAADVMADHGLASYDAVHAATAIATGCPAIVTTDTGFALLPASTLAIYTDRSRLTSARNKRPR